MKSKSKSTTRKKNYKRKNNTRKFRQTINGGGQQEINKYKKGNHVMITGSMGGAEPGEVTDTSQLSMESNRPKGYIIVRKMQFDKKTNKIIKDPDTGRRRLYSQEIRVTPNERGQIEKMTRT